MNPTPPFRIIRPSRANISYKLNILQHPERARCCGFGDKDRRPIDPPVIIQLHAFRDDEELPLSSMDSMLFTIQCDIYSEDQRETRNFVYPPSITNTQLGIGENVVKLDTNLCVKNLLGSVVSGAYELKDLNSKDGIFFIFDDLSVRTEGIFTLRFMFSDLASGEPLSMSTLIQADCYSEPFTVYSAKKTTVITNWFAKQGIKISRRKQKHHLF
ncbi:hypothetical protein K501DRAFT_320055 [Backusella circina FSU 941]|nr:hypothetical protein K501DRAFT_320055 [Backusella circina FSU 941]